MLLAIDVGNTNSEFAVFDGDEMKGSWRLSTDTNRTADEHAVLLRDSMALGALAFDAVDAVIIASVVPQNLFELKTLCKNYFDYDPIIIGEEGVDPGIQIAIDRPNEVGADRIVNAVAAYDLIQSAAIVVDFGTATTFDVINDEGDYIGGLIAPGINLSVEALHKAAAKLPEVAIKKPSAVIGRSTTSAMQSGIYYGYTGLIEGIIAHVKEEYHEPMTVLATGGLAPLFSQATKSIDRIEQNLMFNGLHKIFKINN